MNQKLKQVPVYIMQPRLLKRQLLSVNEENYRFQMKEMLSHLVSISEDLGRLLYGCYNAYSVLVSSYVALGTLFSLCAPPCFLI